MNSFPSHGTYVPKVAQISQAANLGIRARSIDIFDRRTGFWFVDALLFVIFVSDGVALPLVPGNIPVPEFAMIILIVLCLFRGPRLRNVRLGGFALSLLILLVYLLIVSEINEVSWFRRLIRIALLGFFVWMIATGRVDIRAGLFGLIIALIVNIPLYYSGNAPDYYPGFLTGYLGDKNVAGLYYSLIPILALLVVRRRWQKVLLIVLAIGATFLTGSRTSLGALACALIWLAMAGRLGPIIRAMLVLGLVGLLNFVEERFARAWIFADRTGTDALRSRIDEVSLEMVNSAPWYGNGLGTAIVPLDDRTFFFHNAYWGLLVEGGWLFLAIVLFAFIWVGLNPLRSAKRTQYMLVIEASVIIILTCSTRLGEVFITVPSAIVLGCAFAVRHIETLSRRGPSVPLTISHSR